MGYYTEFDFANSQVKMTPLQTANKQNLIAASQPSRVLGTSWWIVIFLGLCIGFVTTVLVFLLLRIFLDINLFPLIDPRNTGLFGQSRSSVSAVKAADQANLTLNELEVVLEQSLLKRQ